MWRFVGFGDLSWPDARAGWIIATASVSVIVALVLAIVRPNGGDFLASAMFCSATP